MKMKVDVWVIVRLDGDASMLSDCVSIKGVYDSEEKARDVLASRDIKVSSARYEIIRSRRFADDTVPPLPKKNPERVQGFDVATPPKICRDEILLKFREFKSEIEKTVPHISPQALHPALYEVTEHMVARALDGTLTPLGTPFDIQVPDGRRVEVKVAFLDENQRKSPTLQLHENTEFELLALVVYRPDFSIHDARLIPSDTLRDFFLSKGASRRLIIRVTPSLLNSPGSAPLDLK